MSELEYIILREYNHEWQSKYNCNHAICAIEIKRRVGKTLLAQSCMDQASSNCEASALTY